MKSHERQRSTKTENFTRLSDIGRYLGRNYEQIALDRKH